MTNEDLNSDDLKPIVEKLAEKLAEDINRSGMEEQLKFLEQNGWTVKDIMRYLNSD